VRSSMRFAQAADSDSQIWNLVEQQQPVRQYSASITRHAIIDELNPFVLYAVNVRSNFSCAVIKKKFDDFVVLQN
jgi:hypothetical protein